FFSTLPLTELYPLSLHDALPIFTLSQVGMVVHWFKLKTKGWSWKAIVNGIGAVATFVVLCTIAMEKVVLDLINNRGREFGWIILDRKSTRLNSSHDQISYAVFCL